LFFFVATQSDLEKLEELQEAIRPNGSIWSVWQKGRKELGESHIRSRALALDLVDVKVASISSELSALKLVVRKELR
jgi:hypothetical protein